MNKSFKYILIATASAGALTTAGLLLFRKKYSAVTIKGRISSKFGLRTDPVTKKPSSQHNGIDIGLPTGTPIFAPTKGTVVEVYNELDSTRGRGIGCKINHGEIDTVYYHMSKIYVTKGQKINAGDKIGLIGSTGKSTGSHLHFGVFNNKLAIWLDPQKTKYFRMA